MSEENALDAAFRIKTLEFEKEQAPVRREFDEMVRVVLASQSLRENGFGAELGDNELIIRRDEFWISAKLNGAKIWVSLSKEGASDWERSMFGMLSAAGRPDDRGTAEGAVGQIGAFMARIIDERFFF